ncbi:lipocalin family protein [Chitinophaga sp. GCM10012297]|uniref:Lipocalin family protein n=1 Tax=Chitinophaga chungangae TaxID=2821488 RepID=A0ABS3YGS5_9BACT|nr:lipocalin family protein [Chitinophaga chungangae]MBO9153309.1 lipocalin family protein [Chitinophaga chungangae]
MIQQLTRFLMVPMAAVLLLSACASQQGASAPTASGMRKNAMGKWTLSNVSYDGLPSTAKIKTVFSNIPPDCLQGSNWVLPSNSYGSYTLTATGEGCPTGTQNIVWSTLNQGGVIMLQFKELMDGVKAKNITDGYRVELQSADNASMVWRAPVSYEGKTAYVVYSFSRQ